MYETQQHTHTGMPFTTARTAHQARLSRIRLARHHATTNSLNW